jgi:hypothetical protein
VSDDSTPREGGDLVARIEKLEAAVLRIAAVVDELVVGNAARDRVAEGFLAFRERAREKELAAEAAKPRGR